jgi:hypothetical protein
MIQAQEIEKHRWKDRLLIIYTTTYSVAEVQKQLDLLQAERDQLKERNVKVYVISEASIWYDFSEQSEPLQDAKPIDKPFEIVLVGLDGGEKFRSGEVQQVRTFIDRIDSMPMRREELRRKNKG